MLLSGGGGGGARVSYSSLGRELRIVLFLQQRPGPRRARLEEGLADDPVAHQPLDRGEVLGLEEEPDVRAVLTFLVWDFGFLVHGTDVC